MITLEELIDHFKAGGKATISEWHDWYWYDEDGVGLAKRREGNGESIAKVDQYWSIKRLAEEMVYQVSTGRSILLRPSEYKSPFPVDSFKLTLTFKELS